MIPMISKSEKLATPYKVTTRSNMVKNIDLEKRTVTGLFNSYFWIDSDFDMLLPGAAAKSIKERGVGTTSGNMIKHLKDHVWQNVMARLDVLDERKVDFNGQLLEGIYHESYYSKATDSNDLLIKIQEGLYDDRSIGFQYVKLIWAEKESENEDNVKNWEKYFPMALNPEKAEERNFFWVVKEIKLFEGSDVAFGANSLTPLLDIKSDRDNYNIRIELFKKLDIMASLFRNGNLTDEGFQKMEMEQLQIKSYIEALTTGQPSIKDTLLEQSRKEIDTKNSRKKLCLT